MTGSVYGKDTIATTTFMHATRILTAPTTPVVPTVAATVVWQMLADRPVCPGVEHVGRSALLALKAREEQHALAVVAE